LLPVKGSMTAIPGANWRYRPTAAPGRCRS